MSTLGKPTSVTIEVLEKILTPWTMRCVRDKTKAWMQQEHLHFDSETSPWDLFPIEYSLHVASQVLTQKKTHEKYALIPHPKKGDKIRHYAAPTLLQHAEATTYLSIFGPVADAQFLDTSLGNRLYRNFFVHDQETKQVQGSYALTGSSIYSKFDHGYKLFQKFTEELINFRVGLPSEKDRYEAREKGIIEETPQPNPYLASRVFREAWIPSGKQDGTEAVYWAKLDLKSAFPSINSDVVANQLEKMVKAKAKWTRLINQNHSGELDTFFLGNEDEKHPWVELSEQHSLRKKLLAQWTDRIRKTTHDATSIHPDEIAEHNDVDCPLRFVPKEERNSKPCQIPEEKCKHFNHGTWGPEDTEQARNHGGQPTGLATSPFLLNVALHGLDVAMEKFCQERLSKNGDAIAYFRFADDMYILGTTKEAVQKSAMRIKDYFENQCQHKFKINESKIEPENLLHDDFGLEILERFKIISPDMNHLGNQLVKDGEYSRSEASDWEKGPNQEKSLARLLELAASGGDGELSNDAALAYSFGGLAYHRWTQEVPGTTLDTMEEVYGKIMAIGSKAIELSPWRPKLWKHAVTTAMRVDAGLIKSELEKKKEERNQPENLGLAWLKIQAARISNQSITDGGKGTWASAISPEPSVDETLEEIQIAKHNQEQKTAWHRYKLTSRELRASFHRATLLNSLSKRIRTIRNISVKTKQNQLPFAKDSWHDDFTSFSRQGIPTSGIVDEVGSAFDDPQEWIAILFPKQCELYEWEVKAIIELLLSTDARAWTGVSDTQSWFSQARTRGGIPDWIANQIWPMVNSIEYQELAHRSNFSPTNAQSNLDRMDAGELTSYCRSSQFLRMNPSQFPAPAKVSAGRSTFALPSHPAYSPTTAWEKCFQFNDYASLWSAWSSLEQFVSIGEMNRMLKLGIRFQSSALPKNCSIRDGMDRYSNSIPSKGHAIGLPQQLQELLLLELESLHPGSYKFPSRIRFKAGEQEFLNFRGFQLGSSRESRIGEANNPQPRLESVKLNRDMPAPAPEFMIPFFLKFSRGKRGLATTWYQACYSVWLGSGSYRELAFLSTQLPFRPPVQKACSLLARCNVNPASTWIKPIFGINKSRFNWELEAPETTESNQGTAYEYLKTIKLIENKIKSKEAKKPKDILVAIGQASKLPHITEISNRAIQANGRWGLTPADTNESERELRELLEKLKLRIANIPTKERGESVPEILLLPEFYVAPNHLSIIQKFSNETRIAVIAGIYLKEALSSAWRHPAIGGQSKRILQNHCAIIIPYQKSETDDEKETRTTTFFAPKSVPSVMEQSIESFLNQATLPNTTWQFERGVEWPVIESHKYANFTTGICADLIGNRFWRKIRDHSPKIQNIYLVAYNQAIDLFERFAYARSYELYANMVLCNHGEQGGSLAWTPLKRRDHAELFNLRGKDQQVIAYARLPIEPLAKAQQEKLEAAIEADFSSLLTTEYEKSIGSHDEKQLDNLKKWWAPPADYKPGP